MGDTKSMSGPYFPSFMSFFLFFSQGEWNCQGVSAEFLHPRAKIILLWTHAHAGPLPVRLPNGHRPTEARSLEVPEVWETLGGKKPRREQLRVYCIRENQIWCVDGKCLRCARACRAIAEKHLTLREKLEICQAHAEIRSCLLRAHPNSFF